MYRKCIGSDPTAARLDFALYEVAGEWESRSGSPRVRIYRNPGRRGGGFYVEVSYKDGTRFSRPVRKYWGGIRYFDLYGYVALPTMRGARCSAPSPTGIIIGRRNDRPKVFTN